jgi:hypothetical protein
MYAQILALLLAIAAASPAFALDACIADSVGAWRGPVWNGAGLQMMDTRFQLDGAGVLVGRYRIYDIVPFDGTLTELRRTGNCEADFFWNDRDGTGIVHIRFEPELGRFLGHWGTKEPIPDLPFNGFRKGPPAIS